MGIRTAKILIAFALLVPNVVLAQNAGWIRPSRGVVSYPFFSESYAQSENVQHVGVDIDGEAGEAVVAPATGTVVINRTGRADITNAYLIIREDGTQLEHVLGHITSGLREGARVRQDEVVGSIREWGGNEHVHWGVYRGNMLASFVNDWGFGRIPLYVTKDEAMAKGWLDPLAGRTSAPPSQYSAQRPSVRAPATPTAIGPGSLREPGTQQSGARLTLEWNAVAGATEYDLGVRDLVSNQIVFDQRVGGTSQRVTVEPGRSYRWNVAACNVAGCSRFAAPLYFTVNSSSTSSGGGGVVAAVPDVPRDLSPGRSSEPGQRMSIDSTTLQWADVRGTTHYEVELRDLTAKRDLSVGQLKQRFHIFKMRKNTSYRWRVRACNSNGCSGWSQRLFFVSP